ncbi:calmodulin-binding transcription activator 4-like protein isoform X2 [Tanacetum coccineum]
MKTSSSNNYATQLASSAGATEFDETYNSTPGPRFLDGSPELDDALKMIQKQLSLENVKDNGTFYNENEYTDDLGFTYNEQNYSGSDNSVSLQYPVLDIAQVQLNTSRNGATDFERLHQYQQTLKDDSTVSSQQNYIWKDVLSYDGDAAYDGSLQNFMYPSDTNEALLSQQQRDPVEEQGKHHSGDTGTSYDCKSNAPFAIKRVSDVNLALQTVEIRVAKWADWVLIVGTFTCDPLNNEWICMFGDTEAPVEIIQEGVISCHAPPHTPGKVTICITSGNQEACSEGSEDSWTRIIEALIDDTLASSRTTDWLLEELLIDKMEMWLSSKPALSKGEQGIIHMVSGLGFVWALAPILKSGVGINFRADVEAERTVNSISNQNIVVEDHLSFKDAIAAVRNATQAASRITRYNN